MKPPGEGAASLSGTIFPHFPLQTLQTLFSAPRLGEPGARAPLFTPETDKLRLDSPFPFLGSGKGLGCRGGCRGVEHAACVREEDGHRWGGDRMREGDVGQGCVCVYEC